MRSSYRSIMPGGLVGPQHPRHRCRSLPRQSPLRCGRRLHAAGHPRDAHSVASSRTGDGPTACQLCTSWHHRMPLPPSAPKPRGPLYNYLGDRSVVSYRHPKMRQQDGWHMPPLVVYLPPTSPAGFQLEFEVRADEIPRPVNGVLNVVLKSKP